MSHDHSGGLELVDPGSDFSDPRIRNNIIRHNRSFYWHTGALLPDPFGDPLLFVYDDFGVVGESAGVLDVRKSLITDITGTHGSNREGDPKYVLEYFNGLMTASAGDEGGNFVQVRFDDLFSECDYHITSGSKAVNKGRAIPVIAGYESLAKDIDGEDRPLGVREDLGADELE